MAAVPVISSYVLQGVPAFIRDEIGAAALRRANRAAGFDVELIEGQNCFVPQQAVLDFAEAAGRAAGEPHLGLLLAPGMDAAAYGGFGRYVFGADTLGEAIRRAIAGLRYHSTFDRLSLAISGDEARFGYASPLAGARGYPTFASAAAGELMSVFRAYLPGGWRPRRVELDIAAPAQASLYEDAFQCPVVFNAPMVAIVFARKRLRAAAGHAARPLMTIEDVARDRPGGAPKSLLAVTIEQIRARALAGGASIDDIARSMGASVRTLQRELHHAGADFRSLTTQVRMQRAIELLRDGNGSITRISVELGYASPAGFARAFRKATGVGPREFRLNGPRDG